MIRLSLALCALCALSAPGAAQNAAALPGTVALTPEEREAAIEAGAERANDISLQYGANDRHVHGALGVEVGSHGERAAYGMLVAPIGQNGVAAMSYGTIREPRWHGRERFRDSSVGRVISSEPPRAPAGHATAEADIVNPD